MKKLLATTAIVMATMTGAAFAQDADFTIVTDNENVDSGDSLLRQVLNQAQDVQVNMLNAAENLANLDGSINVLESANVDQLLRELTGSVSFGDGEQLYTFEVDGEVRQGDQAAYQAAVDASGDKVVLNSVTKDGDGNDVYNFTVDGGDPQTGTLAQFNAALASTDVQLFSVVQGDVFEGILKGVSRTVDGTTAIDFFDPAPLATALQTDVKNLTTTVIGALNTGIIGSNDGNGNIASNILNMANTELASVASTTSSLAQSTNYFEPGDLQLANVAANMATIVDASVTIDQLMANVDTVGTTLIGALNTGDIAASVNQNVSNLSAALVGN